MATVPSSRRDEASFGSIVAKHSQDVVALANGARELVFGVLPGAYEVVWTRQRIAGYGTGPKKMTEHFCWIMPSKSHVTLGFNYGAELDDPEGLLEGDGRLFRHVKLACAADLRRPALRRLLTKATRHRVPPLRSEADPSASAKNASAKKTSVKKTRRAAPAKTKAASARKRG